MIVNYSKPEGLRLEQEQEEAVAMLVVEMHQRQWK